jgi:hypothetical protein
MKLLIARVRLWWLFMRNTDAGPVSAWRFASWRNFAKDEDDECHECELSGPCYCDEVINE